MTGKDLRRGIIPRRLENNDSKRYNILKRILRKIRRLIL